MFKGSPISPISRDRNQQVTISRIGIPQAQVSTNTPIADRYAHQTQGAKTPDSPGWLRRVGDFELLAFANESLSNGFSPLTDYSTLSLPSPNDASNPRSTPPILHTPILGNSSLDLRLRRIPLFGSQRTSRGCRRRLVSLLSRDL